VILDDLGPEELDMRRTILEEDPPRHSRLRQLVNPDFAPRAVRGYSSFISSLTAIVLDRAVAKRHFDFVGEVAQAVPIRVLCKLLGVPRQHTEQLVGLGNAMVSDGPPPPARTADGLETRLLPFGSPAALEAFELATDLALARRNDPRDDVTTRLLTGEVDGRRLTEQEFLTMWLMLVIAGNETTRHAISGGMEALIRRASLLEEWRSSPSMDVLASEEILRWTTPINWHRRTVTRDVLLGGQELRAGDKVLLMFMSANRDEEVFDSPDVLDLRRDPNPHVTFGRGGPHFCLGAHLARLEVQVVFGELWNRVSRVRPAGTVVRLRSDHFNGYVRMPVEVTPLVG
jgi:cytochrome P450